MSFTIPFSPDLIILCLSLLGWDFFFFLRNRGLGFEYEEERIRVGVLLKGRLAENQLYSIEHRPRQITVGFRLATNRRLSVEPAG
ncbi:unnamed protein product [Linum tenue]|uniref:Uncharacterized protein n=1 Tax=Linum tenue TaxID=586396 RepID=A0AAV0QPR2_9ROSI|nr:unnamed protein product [Linum tenue]